MPRRLLPLLTAEIGVLAYAYLHRSLGIAGGFGFPLDDSWIHAHFARNLAEGRGLVYNPGQPVSSTAILYTVLLGAVYRISGAPVFGAMALGLALHAAAAVLIYLTMRWLGVDSTVSTLSAALFAAVPRLVWGALSGMEVPLYVFLVCLGMYWHIRYRWCDGACAYLATAAFALAALARPECAVFFVVSVLDRALSAFRLDPEKGGLKRYLKSVPLHAALFAALIAPAVIFNLVSTGLPLPPPFYVKTESAFGADGMASAIRVVAGYMLYALFACAKDNWVITLGLIQGFRMCLARSSEPSRQGVLIAPTAMLAIPAAAALFAHTGSTGLGLLGQCGRYSAYLTPPLVIVGMLGITDIAREVREWATRKAGCRAVCSWALFMMLAGAFIAVAVGNCQVSRHYARQVENISRMQVSLGKWAAGLSPGSVIAANDVGAIAYFSRHRIVDVEGVVNPEALPYRAKYRRPRQGAAEYLESIRPDYVIVFPNWYPELSSDSGRYVPIKRVKLRNNVVCGGDEMVVYRADWR